MQKLCEMHAYIFLGMGFHNSCSFVCELFFLKLYGGYCSLSVITGKEFDIFKLDRILCSLPLRIFHSLYDVKDYAHKNHNLALQWDGKRQDYSLERNDNLLQATFGWSAIWALASTANYVHASNAYAYSSTKRVSKPAEDWWSSVFHLSNAWARVRACPFLQPSWMTRRSHGERFGKENVLWKKKCFSWMNEACYYFCNCIPLFRMYFERHFDNVFCLQLNFEAKREGPVGWRASTFTLLVFVSWFL